MPEIDAVRPVCCPRCRAASRPPGRGLQLHGHGLVERTVWGPPGAGETPAFTTLRVRRFRCLVCRTVLRVGPRGVHGGLWYGAGTVALALALLALSGVDTGEVRSQVSPYRVVAFETRRRWRSLERWTGAVASGRLWRGPLRLPSQSTPRRTAMGFVRLLVASAFELRVGQIGARDAFRVAHSGGWVV